MHNIIWNFREQRNECNELDELKPTTEKATQSDVCNCLGKKIPHGWNHHPDCDIWKLT